MSDTTTTDIAQLAQDALAEATNPDKIKGLVFDHINKTVEEAVKDAVRSYSPFGRDLQKKVEEALSLNTLNLPSYNTMICGMVQKLVATHTSTLIEARLAKDIAEMLKVAPKEIRLSAIVEQMTERKKDMDGHGEVTCIVEHREPARDLWGPEWTIYLDETECHSWANRNMAEVKIDVWHGIKANNHVTDDDLNKGTIRSIFEHGSTIASKSGFTTASLYGLTGNLLALYAAETVITIDEDEVITSVNDY